MVHIFSLVLARNPFSVSIERERFNDCSGELFELISELFEQVFPSERGPKLKGPTTMPSPIFDPPL